MFSPDDGLSGLNFRDVVGAFELPWSASAPGTIAARTELDCLRLEWGEDGWSGTVHARICPEAGCDGSGAAMAVAEVASFGPQRSTP